MIISKNPARSRPLSANVKRLMTMARESPINPDVKKIERPMSARDLLYCDMQGRIFMAATDRGISMRDFAPMFMTSQLAGVIDHSFSVAGSMESDDISNYLQLPILLKSPETIVDVVLWLEGIVNNLTPNESANMAVVQACMNRNASETEHSEKPLRDNLPRDANGNIDTEALTASYEYAYWLGYIYRCECRMHDESSRMVFGAFGEDFMKRTYDELIASETDALLTECAAEICRRLDMLLIGKLWKENKS